MKSLRKISISLMALLLLSTILFGAVSCTKLGDDSTTVDLPTQDDTTPTDQSADAAIGVYVADVSVVDGEILVTMSDGTVKNLGEVATYITNHNVTVNGTTDAATEQSAAKALLSTVGVACGFTVTQYVSTGPFGGGYSTRDVVQYGYGSGVIYQLDKVTGSAYIITNYHVVYSADCKEENGISQDIGIYMFGDIDMIDATFVGGSDKYDIAILRVENEPRLQTSAAQAVTLAEGYATVGERALIAGNANANGLSVTEGIVSVDSEYITMSSIRDESTTDSFRVIRTDGSVNPGNSGGGLYNANAELIGIVNAKTVDEDTEGMGYAIPVDIAITIADKVIDGDMDETQTTRRVLLGITLTISESSLVYDTESGTVYIEETVVVVEDSAEDGTVGVAAGSLGETAGVQSGDTLVSIQVGTRDTLPITRQYQVIDEMLKARAGDTIILVIDRNGTSHTLTVVVPTDYHD